MLAAIVAGIAVPGLIYWQGGIESASLVLFGPLLFPVYLIFVATVLSVWLGFDKGPGDLRAVDPEDIERTEWERRLP